MIEIPSFTLYFCGGQDSQNKNLVLKSVFKILYENQSFSKFTVSPMNNTKFECSLHKVSSQTFYSIGGFKRDKCEKFEIDKGNWTEIPSLSERKSAVGTCKCNNYIYVFGGHLGSRMYSSIIERKEIDKDKEGWEILTIKNNSLLSTITHIRCTNISSKRIKLFGWNKEEKHFKLFSFHCENKNLDLIGNFKKPKGKYFMSNLQNSFCFFDEMSEYKIVEKSEDFERIKFEERIS